MNNNFENKNKKIRDLVNCDYYNINMKNKEKYEQFYTPSNVSIYMANMFDTYEEENITILDAGSGFGILSIYLVSKLLENKTIKSISLTLYEIDNIIVKYLESNMKKLKNISKEMGIEFNFEIKNEDFIYSAVESIKNKKNKKYNYVITNPPYKKMNNSSTHKIRLKSINIDVSNYYAAFILLSCIMLKKNGEIVAITPRSFCNGTYFYNFRKDLLSNMYFKDIHIFDSRKAVFNTESILQEVIIYHCKKNKIKKKQDVNIYYSNNSEFKDLDKQIIKHRDLVYGDDLIIRLPEQNEGKIIIEKMMSMKYSFNELNIDVSTGPIVDFRELDKNLSVKYKKNGVPIIYPENIAFGKTIWPLKKPKKYNYIIASESNMSKLRANGNYVLVKRITSKEENRRIISSIYDESVSNFKFVGFDNKVNYYHIKKEGMNIELAKGLCIYLNSTFVDIYFRMISGSTQVNVRDLKNIRYPDENQLIELGLYYDAHISSQEKIDEIIESVLFHKSIELNNEK